MRAVTLHIFSPFSLIAPLLTPTHTTANDGHITQPVPQLVQESLPEIESFAKDLHDKVLDPLNHLIALALELPPDFFTKLHRWDVHDESHLRYMNYGKYSPEEVERLAGGHWADGHTDLGTITLLFRQPVAALQIKDHGTGQWKWAKPLDGSLTVNTCDALSFLTGGYIKSTVHRVTLPPKDQRHVDRLGLLYFARPQNDLVLKTVDSPVLKREGFTQNEFEAGGHRVPTMGGEYSSLMTLLTRYGPAASGRHGLTHLSKRSRIHNHQTKVAAKQRIPEKRPSASTRIHRQDHRLRQLAIPLQIIKNSQTLVAPMRELTHTTYKIVSIENMKAAASYLSSMAILCGSLFVQAKFSAFFSNLVQRSSLYKAVIA